jgi:hypothetical protein
LFFVEQLVRRKMLVRKIVVRKIVDLIVRKLWHTTPRAYGGCGRSKPRLVHECGTKLRKLNFTATPHPQLT